MRKKVNLDDRGKILIPSEFRKKIGIEPGQRVILETNDKEICIRKYEEEGPDLHELAKKLSGGL